MRLDIAQMITLTSYGNAYLDNQSFTIDLHSTTDPCKQSTTDTCKKIDFIEVISNGETSEAILVANNPDEWFEYLRNSDVINLKLHFPPTGGDRNSAPIIGGGGRWIIEVNKGPVSDVWDVKWQYDSSRGKIKIWSVTYALTSKNYNFPIINYPPLEYWHKQLIVEIMKIKKFAVKQSLVQYVAIFQNALDCIESDDPLSLTVYDNLVPPEKYDLKAKQILAACTNAWIVATVDWNELIFKGKVKKEYIKLSNDLYLKICRAIMVATNSIH